MISYPKFKKIIMEKIRNEIGEEYPDWELKEETRYSINQKIESLSFMPENTESDMVMPSYRFAEMYSGYVNGYTPAQIARDICQSMRELIEKSKALFAESLSAEGFSAEGLSAEEALPSGLCFETDVRTATIVLINPDINQELLKNVPSSKFLDLAIMFRIVAQNGRFAVNVTNQMLADSGLEVEELLKIACENTFREYPPVIEKRDDAYFISADRLDICSHVLCSDDAFCTIAEEADDDLYVIATSLFGILVIPSRVNDDSDISEIGVKYWNIIRQGERLSPSIYFYDRMNHKLEICKKCRSKNMPRKAQFS